MMSRFKKSYGSCVYWHEESSNNAASNNTNSRNNKYRGYKHKDKINHKRPFISATVLAVIVLGCICSGGIASKDPGYMDFVNASHAPCREFLFGTDTMGRDIWSGIWNGGRLSLTIGVLSAAVATFIALIIGTLSAVSSDTVDAVLMRLTDILISIPSLPLVILLQAVLGDANVISLALVIGSTGWMNMAKVVRTEVRQLRNAEYVLAAKSMGGGFWYILRQHLAPNLVPSLMFMSVMTIRSAIVSESTLSFMGIGLPTEVISWGSMLSLAEKAMLTDAWWIIVIPGLFLAVTIACITELANAYRRSLSHRHSNVV